MTQSECQEKICFVLVGGTGCGKSTLTNVLSKGGAKTSSSSKSCTKKCTIYDVDSKTKLMDTPGFDDSDNLSDREIIIMMATALGQAKLPKIKLVWCVEVSSKMKTSLQRQAKLINALGDSVWKSLIIVVKKGDPDESNDWQGAKDCAKEHGGIIKDENCLCITNIDCLTEKKQKKLQKRDFETRSEDGKYFSHEIKKFISEKLGKLPSFEAKLREIYHHASSSYRHSGYLQYYNKCTGCSRSPNRCIYKYRSVKHKTWYCHTSGCYKQFSVGDSFYHCWPCCDRKTHSNDQYVVGCRGMTCVSCVERKSQKYSCCSGSSGSSGCVWSCCGISTSSTLTFECGEITYEPQGL